MTTCLPAHRWPAQAPIPLSYGKTDGKGVGSAVCWGQDNKGEVENGCGWGCVDMAKEKSSAQGQSSNYTARLMAPFMNYFYLFSPVPPIRYATAFYIVG